MLFSGSSSYTLIDYANRCIRDYGYFAQFNFRVLFGILIVNECLFNQFKLKVPALINAMLRTLLVIAAIIGASHLTPVPKAKHFREINDVDKTDIMQILHTNGIMINVHKLDTQRVLNRAIRKLQDLVNLPVTGIMDEASFDVLNWPRCGTTQKELSAKRRRKRFITTSKYANGNKTEIVWSFNNQTLNHPNVGHLRRLITKAFNLWLKNTNLTVREVTSYDKNDFTLGFYYDDHNDGYPFDGFGKVLAHAFYPSSSRHFIHFDASEPWSVTNSPSDRGVNFGYTALHEIGHALGLGHSSDKAAIMSSFYKVDPINPLSFDKLPADDQLAINSLYGEKERSWGPYQPYKSAPNHSN